MISQVAEQAARAVEVAAGAAAKGAE